MYILMPESRVYILILKVNHALGKKFSDRHTSHY